MSKDNENRAIEESLRKRLQDAELAPPSFQDMLGPSGVVPEPTPFFERLVNILKLGQSSLLKTYLLVAFISTGALQADQHIKEGLITSIPKLSSQEKIANNLKSSDEIKELTLAGTALNLPENKKPIIQKSSDSTTNTNNKTTIKPSKNNNLNKTSGIHLSKTPKDKFNTQRATTNNVISQNDKRSKEIKNEAILRVESNRKDDTKTINGNDVKAEDDLDEPILTQASKKESSNYLLSKNQKRKKDPLLQSLASLTPELLPTASPIDKLSFGKRRPSKKGEFYLGTFYGVNSIWIFNQNIYGQFGGRELPYTKAMGHLYGAKVGYQRYKGLGVELNVIPSFKKGQNYQDMINNTTINRSISLDYMEIPFWLKYRFLLHGTKKLQVSLGPEVGFSWSKLKEATETINGTSTDITTRFKSTNWQALAGVSSEIYFSKKFTFSIGLRGGISDDINAEGWQVNDNYGKSHNFAWGLQFGLNYRFNKKTNKTDL